MSKAARPLVLLIDDELEAVEGLIQVLAAAGYATRWCGSAESAMRFASRETIDLIVCDLSLQGENGPETCERIMQVTGQGRIPVMYLSVAQIPDIIRRSQETGGHYYLRKPVSPQVVLELIDRALWGTQLRPYRTAPAASPTALIA